MNLTNKIAVVTGANKGIGLHCVEQLFMGFVEVVAV